MLAQLNDILDEQPQDILVQDNNYAFPLQIQSLNDGCVTHGVILCL